ncbi:MAG TPA: TrkH family potassium uptake protein [Candidatus Ventrousia excrementavium]|uniref:TrkH family potassium uptake protein n=1 Tax=Candidatus Ventrousia excrementavium TaxID=2840961 RepID=A0A9D1ITQ5_9CLOT|nr:TrkH family potassium uptake protein [Candidatus Ventrousia excrementavium]
MNTRMIARTVGLVIRIEAVLLLLPAVVGLLYGEHETLYFLLTAALALGLSLLLTWKKPVNTVFYARDGLLIVAFSWIAMSVLGALPFYLSGEIPSFVDSFFETVSGFTTTGSSILTDVESLSRGMLFWRSFTHWIGGMGILVFALAVLPAAKGEGRAMHIMRAEMPGPSIDKLVPKMRSTALILYAVYLVMTIIEIVLLLLGGMDLFDSVVNSFGTAGTGGFSVRAESIGAYHSSYAEWVIGIFMLLFGINFNIYYLILLGKFKSALKSQELRWYLVIIALATGLIAFNVAHLFDSLDDTIRAAFFQVSSIITTTGYASLNYDVWPTFSKMVLILLTALGACAGSTGGGLKVSRLVMLVKSIGQEIRAMIHPRAVKNIKFEGRPVSKMTLDEVMVFFAAYVLLLLGSMLVVALDGFDLVSTSTAVLTCVGNVGPGLGMVGPAGNFSEFSILSKLVLSFDMLAGRLEIFPMFILFAPRTWKRN